MSSIVTKWKEQIKLHKKHLTLPEYMDDRTYKAAEIIVKEGLVQTLSIVGPTKEIESRAKTLGVLLDGIKIIDPQTDPNAKDYCEKFFLLREKKGLTREQAIDVIMKDVCFYSAMMLREGHTDAVVLGAYHTSGHVIRAGIQAVGSLPGVKTVSGCFYMESTQGKEDLIVGDSAVIPDPTSEQLADIAIASAGTYRTLRGKDPKVAFLSFSTMGSAEHERVTKVRDAIEILKSRNVDFEFDGELQYDAAMVPEVGKFKAPNSKVAGQATVLIFPNLDAGNIGYKIMERSGAYKAYGPLIQGLAKPYNDLSRGSSVEEIVTTSVITLLRS